MSLYSQFQTDTDLEKSGVTLQYGVNGEGEPIEILIARAGGANTQFAKRLEAATRPYKRQIQNGTMEMETLNRIMRRVYAETIILDWSGVEGPDGEPLEFSVDNVEKVLGDLPDLFRDIQEQAQNIALFREEILEADSGN